MTSIPKKLSQKYNKCINYKMKDYGRDGHQKKGKKKKRKFEVIMNIGNTGNTGTQGIYTDLTLRKVANKVTSKLVGKKKHIIFHLREKGKYEKIYGPYIGSIKDGKAIVRIHKMSGGDLIDCVFNKITVNNFKADVKDPPEIKITKFCFTMAIIIFFDFLEYKKKIYYKYAIYKEKDTVFVIELENSNNKLQIKNIEIKNIINKDFLNKIMVKINEKQGKNPKFAVKIKEKIQNGLDSIKNHKQKIFSSPETLFSEPKSQGENEFNRKLNKNFKTVLQESPRTFLPPTVKLFQKPPPVSNSETEFLKIYICPIKNFTEVKQNAFSQIGFGFDSTLFTGTLYYKYIYIGKNTFKELFKDERGYDDREIEISKIDLYDLLCLMEFAKLNNNIWGDLLTLIYTNINLRLKTGLITISLSDHSFFNLKNSNYNKKRITNLGKIKRKQEFTKDNTYYFFGRNSPNNFKYVCYLLDDKIFYFEIETNIKEHPLEELKDRNAIQELKSFIILRRLGTNNPNFGEPIYQKVSEIIRNLKLKEIHSG